jgi:hypothetical protein
MVEENDRPGGERGPEGPARRVEGDLLAERRALRATDGGEAALLRRAEAAEATVHTLERHVSSLQQRLGEADSERQRLAGLLEAERTVAVERESELRRVKQREYAEQQLRVEAEGRLVGLDRESRAGVQELSARLQDSERHAGELAAKLDAMQRQLAEAEQAIAAERASARRLDEELRTRIAELELRAAEVESGLRVERGARERAERLLETIRSGHRRMEEIVSEVRSAVGRLGGALSAPPPAAAADAADADSVNAPAEPALRSSPYGRPLPRAPQRSDPPRPRGNEMADALAAAVERLRARAEAAQGSDAQGTAAQTEAAQTAPTQSAPAETEPAPTATDVEAAATTGAGRSPLPPPRAAEAFGHASTTEQQEGSATQSATAPGAAHMGGGGLVSASAERPSHKHSKSLIGRIRFRRKQRRGR